MMLQILLVLAVSASAAPWQPEGGLQQLALWPGPPPDQRLAAGPEETLDPVTLATETVAGKPWLAVGNVVKPTMVVYPAKGQNTGKAVLVFPGGGYRILAIDLEGTEVCDWLTSVGVTCAVLKYRVPGNQGYPKPGYPKAGPYPYSPIALDDAQRAMGLLRAGAAKWGIDPKKIGVLGFSAGGSLVADISNNWRKRIYPPVDDADKVSCRPDFAVAVYPGHLSLGHARWDAAQAGKTVKEDKAHPGFNPNLRVTKDTPPTFILQAEDDPVDDIENSISYFRELKSAGVPAELHVYPHGGHAFGLRHVDGKPITDWPKLVERWLDVR